MVYAMEVTLSTLTMDVVDSLLANYDKNYTTIARLFEEITGSTLGRCYSCRIEAEQVLRNYVTQRMLQQQSQDEHGTTSRRRRTKEENS